MEFESSVRFEPRYIPEMPSSEQKSDLGLLQELSTGCHPPIPPRRHSSWPCHRRTNADTDIYLGDNTFFIWGISEDMSQPLTVLCTSTVRSTVQLINCLEAVHSGLQRIVLHIILRTLAKLLRFRTTLVDIFAVVNSFL